MTVIVGSGSNDTRHSVELTKMAAEAGADAALIDAVLRAAQPGRNSPALEAVAARSLFPGFECRLQHSLPAPGSTCPQFPPPNWRRSTKSRRSNRPMTTISADRGADVLRPATTAPSSDNGSLAGRAASVASTPTTAACGTIWDLWQEWPSRRGRGPDNQLQPLYEARWVSSSTRFRSRPRAAPRPASSDHAPAAAGSS